MSIRIRILLAVTGVLVLAAAATVYTSLARHDARTDAAEHSIAVTRAPVTVGEGLLFFSYNDPGEGQGVVAAVPMTEPLATRRISQLHCDRFSAASGKAICLRPSAAPLPASEVLILNHELGELRSVEVPGIPSRAQLSANGRMASWTTFVTGDSYARGSFSTRSGILDTETGELIANIEDIPLYLDGERHRAMDVNYWGITFAGDDDTFYATVSTGGETHLVRGQVSEWEARALRSNVECPSLSADGTRLVFKKRVHAGNRPWRLHVLDLATMTERPLAETSSIDDQVAWLDDNTLAYTKPAPNDSTNIWSVPADGSGQPRLLVRSASSPSTPR
ncbi:TolB family protein [Amycolatopsis palatopharyngis]|uniref:TolB family protein n=1 Tax=Amycolatopsis palatopharyngis TaxID=187982 RepID=UPI000E22E410|nr:hypothetical protein [Amycolatopsis palatopharyngis]